jgi:putative FmdB family regulatory protein
MPLYTYWCTHCGAVFERIVPVAERDAQTHDVEWNHVAIAKRFLSAPAGIQMPGHTMVVRKPAT